ncbi:helix-turn-helix domain-containing protein [Tepidibacillus infernus]|uniref:Helicase Helix-turn-helix domain-containing protein n=1 Tax=Tepidibacillus decaturensis TaxID=1413211 RepID=A0A135L2W9_9BACI|nr:helix-turn-helix domain-containing protein [Tepidibacillus decaturensis]KXG43368.1 hypothetical protein U473_04575 [Tepidibacillus decaturensis]
MVPFFILWVVYQLNGDRSITGVVRILKGSYAKQTIQDTQFYNLHPYYGLFDGISANEIINQIEELTKHHFLYIQNEQLIITPQGINQLDKLKRNIVKNQLFHIEQDHSILLIDRTTKNTFWKRLSLLIQTLSYLSYHDFHFSPVISDLPVQKWVKKLLISNTTDRVQRLTNQLHLEMNQLKDDLSEPEQKILLYRLSGRHRMAFTWRQLEEELGYSIQEIKIMFNNLTYRLLQKVYHDPTRFKLLNMISEIDNKRSYLSPSTIKTMQLLNHGFSIEEIARKRGLTEGTIYDHIVEIILHSPIDLTRFTDEWKIEQIRELYRSIGSTNLSEYKKRLDPAISYHEIRMVLADQIKTKE